jgi:hypothetical protein
MSDNTTWYTVTVIKHDKHPREYTDGDSDKPTEVVSATVRTSLAGNLLRAAADDISPIKPTMRGSRSSEDR